MLELTVKTLDSQNHSFTLSDEATVLDLKESILEKMEVPIASQRLIFHGKVLKDQKKLTEYGDVNGKVIHLVQRAPPSSSARPSDGPSSRVADSGGNTGRRFIRRDGNPTFLGSMTFPSFSSFAPGMVDNGLELPTRPSQMMARNRIDCARRMIGYARNSINYMANPSSQPQPSPSGRQRRLQPFASAPPADERGTHTDADSSATDNLASQQDNISPTAAPSTFAAVITASTQSAIGVLRGPSTSDGQVELSFVADDLNFDDHHQDVAVEVEIESTDANGEGRSDAEANVRDNSVENRTATRPEEGVRVDAMVPLLSDLESINTELQPFLSRCRDLLSADNSFDDNSSPSYQEAVRVFGGVSETLHSIAHACHALSDLMVDFDEDAPRSLRCRPVVLQHSTILEAGIPLRLNPHEGEGQINVRRLDIMGNNVGNADAATAPPTNDAAPPPTATASSVTPTLEPSPQNTPASSSATTDLPGGGSGFTSVQVGPFPMNGPDGIPGDLEIFMDFGLDPTFISTSNAAPNRDATTTATTNNTNTTNTTTTSAAPPPVHISNFPSMNTILSGPFMGGAGQINLQPAVDAIAGHFRNQLIGAFHAPDIAFSMRSGNRHSPTAPGVPGASSTPNNAASPSPATSAASTSEGPGQSSTPRPASESSSSNAHPEVGAARTRLNATTTTTRGTTAAPEQAAAGSQTTPPRRTAHPHGMIDMLQSIFQGSFDPALPCNSHHIRASRPRQQHRVRVDYFPPIRTQAPQVVARSLGGRIVAVTVPPPLPMPSTGQPPRPETTRNAVMDQFVELSRQFENSGTAAEFLNQFVPHVEGRSIVSDLLMTMARNITWRDLLQLLEDQSRGIESIFQRLRPVIYEFTTQRLLQGETPSREVFSQASDRVFAEMRPLIDAMNLTRVRQSIDLTATVANFNRANFPSILTFIMDRTANEFGSDLILRITNYLRQLCSIIRYCCVDNDHTFDSVVRNCVRQLTRGVPEPLQQWTEMASVSNFHYYLTNLSVVDVSHYMVPLNTASSTPASVEPMETDGATIEKPEDEVAEALVAMETENLPEVVLGAEQWHSSLPNEWVPVIARDGQRQRKQNSQKPFSDAYLSGMPPKRRKIITTSKPPSESLPQTISDGVRQAIEAAGVSSPLADRAVAEAGRDPTLQDAYKEQEKKSVGPKIKDDPDFKPSRFPNAHPYFK